MSHRYRFGRLQNKYQAMLEEIYQNNNSELNGKDAE